jgi:cell division protein YceG involved in septum cleavage
MDDWSDPFAEEETARARERRRSEREAQRRDRRGQRGQLQGALAERVRGLMGGAAGDGADAEPRVESAPAARTAATPPSPPEGPSGALGARQPPPRDPNRRRRRLIAVAAVVLFVVGVVAVAAALIHHYTAGSGSPPPRTHAARGVKNVTIPEGYDRHQLADLAKKDGLKGDYLKASESFKGFDPAKYGADNPSSLEGFLFPATYELPRRPTVDDLIARQLDAFKQYMSKVNMGYAKSKNLTQYDVLIIASMIEREAVVGKDRKLIAAVIYNRLHDGMPLQIDATIRYAENNWTKPLTNSDLHIDSPYNTYTHTTLPPTPIGNPGLASIQAAAHPANVDYLYYVAKPNGCGHFFTASYQEFLQANQRYESARAAAGGKSPANCS